MTVRPTGAWLAALLACALTGGAARAAPPDLMAGGFFMGVNYPGLDSWFNGDGHAAGLNYAVPAESDFDYLASRGIRLVRLPFRWEHLCPTAPDGPLDAGYLAQLRRVAGWAQARGMAVVLDMHNYAAYRGRGYDDKADIGQPGAPTADQLAATWGRLAAASRDWPGVAGYDTMNEPVHVPDLLAMQTKVVAAIRAAGATQPIAIEGNHYSTAGTWVADGNEALYDVPDPLRKLIIEAHVYPDCDSSGTHSYWATQSTDPSRDNEAGTPCTRNQAVTVETGAARVAVFLRSARAHGARIWLGEVGAARDQPWRLAVDNVVAAVRDAGGFVTYWSAGAGYTTYSYTVQPQGPGQQPGDVVDTPMMANIEKYTGFTAIPYGLSGPRAGPPGGASGPFTLVVHGFLPRAVTVTPSDGGAGGRFDPPTVVVPAGFDGSPDGMAEPSLHFTYTAPRSPGVFALTVRNDGGLADPPARGYATRPDPFAGSGLVPVAIFSPAAIEPARIGPTVLLRRASDGRVASYAPRPATGELDAGALAQDAAGGGLRVVSLPNGAAGGAGLDAAPPSGQYPGPDAGPAFLPRAAELGGRPGWQLDHNRLAAPVDLGGQAQACVFVDGVPARPGSLVSWASPAADTFWRFPGARGSWDLRLNGGPTLTLGPPPDRAHAHVYAMCFDHGAASLFVDGARAGRGAAGAAVLPTFDGPAGRGFPPTMAVGFDPAYNDASGIGYAAGTLEAVVVTAGAWTDEGVASLSHALGPKGSTR